MSNWKLSQRLSYHFGHYISKGTGSFAMVLLVITLLSVAISTVLLTFVNGDNTLLTNIHDAIVYTLAPDNLLSVTDVDPKDYVPYLIVALCGLLITSTLVALIVTAFNNKLESLSKGHSKVAEDDHTVILGFNENTYTIIDELIAAHDSGSKACIVIGADEDKMGMQEAIHNHTSSVAGVNIVCRSGRITDPLLYDRCSLETCRNVIVAENDDAVVIKVILGIVDYLEQHEAVSPDRRICVLVNSEDNFEVALLAGKGMVDLLYVQDNIAGILSQTCHQPGLARVYSNLFNFDGDEIYFDAIPQLVGKRFGDLLPMFRKGVPLGICRNDDTLLNPARDMVIQQDDRIIIYEDRALGQTPDLQMKLPSVPTLTDQPHHGTSIHHLLVLGNNEMLPGILDNLCRYMPQTIYVTVVTRHDTTEIESRNYDRISLKVVHMNPMGHDALETATQGDFDHVLTLSDYTQDPEAADARTLLQLIHLRDINERHGGTFKITSEIRTPDNEHLARASNARDYVVGTRIISIMLVQLAKNHLAWKIFAELLDATGSEVSVVAARDYVPLNTPIDFYQVTAAAEQHGDIALGYERVVNGVINVKMNPDKASTMTFDDDDNLIVLTRSWATDRQA